MRPGVDDDEWFQADNFGALKRRANSKNFHSSAFQSEVKRRNAEKSPLVLRRMLVKMGEVRDAAEGFYSSYADQWSWPYVPMHLEFSKTPKELKEERAAIACHNSTLKVIKRLLAEKEKESSKALKTRLKAKAAAKAKVIRKKKAGAAKGHARISSSS